MELKGQRFTPLYDFVMARKDLCLLEKLLLCRALRWDGPWYESTKTVAQWLGCNRRTVQRLIKQLVNKGELAPLYETKRKRELWPTIKDLPLFEKMSMGAGVGKTKKLQNLGAMDGPSRRPQKMKGE